MGRTDAASSTNPWAWHEASTEDAHTNVNEFSKVQWSSVGTLRTSTRTQVEKLRMTKGIEFTFCLTPAAGVLRGTTSGACAHPQGRKRKN